MIETTQGSETRSKKRGDKQRLLLITAFWKAVKKGKPFDLYHIPEVARRNDLKGVLCLRELRQGCRCRGNPDSSHCRGFRTYTDGKIILRNGTVVRQAGPYADKVKVIIDKTYCLHCPSSL